MIRHIVFFSAKNPDDIPAIITALEQYRDIPGVQELNVARNLKRDPLANDIDIVLHAVFKTEAALEAYKAHSIYKEGTDIVRPLRDLRVVADIEFSS